MCTCCNHDFMDHGLPLADTSDPNNNTTQLPLQASCQRCKCTHKTTQHHPRYG